MDARVEQFFSLPEPQHSCPKYRNIDTSRYPDSPGMFDAEVKLPHNSYTNQTIVLYSSRHEARLVDEFLNDVYHPCLLRPIKRDCRQSRTGKKGMVAHIYDLLPEKLSEWIARRQDDLWEMDEDGTRIVSVGERFRIFYGNVIKYFKVLHDDRRSHDRGVEGLYITNDLRIKVVDIPKSKDQADMDITGDLDTIRRIVHEVLLNNVPDGFSLPVSVPLYFAQWNFFSSLRERSDFSLLCEIIYMPPLIYSWKQRADAIYMASDYKSALTYYNWEAVFKSILNPSSGEVLFQKGWRKAISRVTDKRLKKKYLDALKADVNLESTYKENHGIVNFHRNFLVHHKEFQAFDPEQATERLLFELWPDYTPMICYGILCIHFGGVFTNDYSLSEKPDFLELLKESSLTFQRLTDNC